MVLALLKDRPGKVFIGGGYVRAIVANEHVNDIDLFTTDKDSALSAARFLLGLKEGEEPGRKIHESANAFTVRGLRVPVQIIHRWTYTDPAAMVAEPRGRVYMGTGTFLPLRICSSLTWETFLWSTRVGSWVGTKPGSLGKLEAIVMLFATMLRVVFLDKPCLKINYIYITINVLFIVNVS